MNDLHAFLEEKTRVGNPLPASDKTDKTASVGFVSESLARSRGSSSPVRQCGASTFAPEAAKHIASKIHSNSENDMNTWNLDEAVTALRRTLRRIEKRSFLVSRRAGFRTRAAIAEFGPIIQNLFLKQDLNSLHFCLLDLERTVADVIRPRLIHRLLRHPEPSCKG